MDISIIVPVYHGKRYIEAMIKQIESNVKALGSDYGVELLLVNDAPDDPIDIVYSSRRMDVIVLNTDKNRGIQGARVRGLEVCRGEYILFLDQDDIIRPEYLKSQMSMIGAGDACVCRALHEGRQYYDEVKVFEREVSKVNMLEKGCGIVSPGQVLLRKTAISEVWKKKLLAYNGADDWLLWLCMFYEDKKFVLNQEILFEHVVDGTNTSCNMEKMMLSEDEVHKVLSETTLLSEEQLWVLKETIKNVQSKRFSFMDKFKKQFFVYDTWMGLESQGKMIGDYLSGKGYNVVAIYGYGFLGKQLLGRLKKEGIEVSFVIDRNANYLDCSVPIYQLDDVPRDVDVIVVTVLDGDDGLKENLKNNLGANVVTLRSILDNMKTGK